MFVWPTSHVGMLHPLAPAGSRAQEQGLSFLRMAAAASDGVSYAKAKALFTDVDRATVETRKSLYEELGLLYVPRGSDELHLTAVGRQILDLLDVDPPTAPSADLRRQIDSLLCWSMAHTQINRPQSLGSPEIAEKDRAECDIRPYAAFWQAMFTLDGYVTRHEFERVLAHLKTVASFPDAVAMIKEARRSGGLPDAPAKSDNFGIYWRAHLSVANEVLHVEDGVFRFAPKRAGILKYILQFLNGCSDSQELRAPPAKQWQSVHEYFSYAGKAAPNFIASGRATVVAFGGESIVFLRGTALQRDAQGYYLDGGAELCSLLVGTPCFHASETNRMLRVDLKTSTDQGRIRVRFGLGRPINDVRPLLGVWGEP